MLGGIRERVASFIKVAPDRQTKDLLREVLSAMDKPFDLEWAKAEYKLTPTEFKVLGYLVEGKQASVIAELTNSQISTVRVHISRIYRKADVNNYTELSSLMLRRARFL